MAECIKCGEYTKFNGGLCTKCYNNKNTTKSEARLVLEIDDENDDDDDGHGLSDKERNYRSGMIKARIAGNGKIAIEKLHENNYDIILMDLLMPVLNGFEATQHIRNKMNSQIPIIALTADVTTMDVEKCNAVGMNDYISKPIDEKLLYNKIIKYLKKTN